MSVDIAVWCNIMNQCCTVSDFLSPLTVGKLSLLIRTIEELHRRKGDALIMENRPRTTQTSYGRAQPAHGKCSRDHIRYEMKQEGRTNAELSVWVRMVAIVTRLLQHEFLSAKPTQRWPQSSRLYWLAVSIILIMLCMVEPLKMTVDVLQILNVCIV